MDFNTGDGPERPEDRSSFDREAVRPAGGHGGEFDLSDPINSFVSTVRTLVLNPVGFFRGIAREGNFLNPLLFAVICALISGILGGIINFFITLASGNQGRGFGGALASLIGSILLTPIFTAIGLLVGAVIYHLLVLLFVRPANAGFEATFRVVSYISVTQLVSWIPIIGPIIAFAYGVVLSILGIREVHSTSTGRAALVVLIPVAVILLLVVVLIALIGAALFFVSQQS